MRKKEVKQNNTAAEILKVHTYFLFFFVRLWAEVFHVTTSSSGTVKWTQVSEDLVPVNISCSQDANGIRFHVTAYNSQVKECNISCLLSKEWLEMLEFSRDNVCISLTSF